MTFFAVLLDLILLLLILFFAFLGYRKGMLSTLISFASGFASLFLSLLLSAPLREAIKPSIQGPYADKVAYAIAFIVLYVILRVVSFILTKLAKKFNNVPILGKTNRILGLVLGLVNGLFIAWGVCVAFHFLLPSLPAGEGTLLYGFNEGAPLIYSTLSKINPLTLLSSVLIG